MWPLLLAAGALLVLPPGRSNRAFGRSGSSERTERGDLGRDRDRSFVVPVPLTVAVACIAIGVVWGSWSVALGGPLLAWRGERILRRRHTRRRAAALDDALVAFVDHMALQLRSGSVLVRAFEAAAAEGPAALQHHLAPVRQRLAAGAEQRRAFATSPDRLPAPPGAGAASTELLLSTLGVLSSTGGSAMRAMDQLGDTLRARRSARGERRAQASQASASSVALAGLPVVFAGALIVAEPEVGAFFLWSPIGAVCSVGGAALILAGHEWMDRLIWGRECIDVGVALMWESPWSSQY